MELYLQEPLESRYSNDLMRNESRKKALYLRKSELERISTFFIEKEMTAQSLDSMFSKSSSFSFSRLGFSVHKRIYVCPFCLALFAEAASASFDVRNAQIKAMEAAALDDDWDDDDWD